MTVLPCSSEQNQGRALLRRILYGMNDAKALEIEGLGGMLWTGLDGMQVCLRHKASRDIMQWYVTQLSPDLL